MASENLAWILEFAEPEPRAGAVMVEEERVWEESQVVFPIPTPDMHTCDVPSLNADETGGSTALTQDEVPFEGPPDSHFICMMHDVSNQITDFCIAENEVPVELGATFYLWHKQMHCIVSTLPHHPAAPVQPIASAAQRRGRLGARLQAVLPEVAFPPWETERGIIQGDVEPCEPGGWSYLRGHLVCLKILLSRQHQLISLTLHLLHLCHINCISRSFSFAMKHCQCPPASSTSQGDITVPETRRAAEIDEFFDSRESSRCTAPPRGNTERVAVGTMDATLSLLYARARMGRGTWQRRRITNGLLGSGVGLVTDGGPSLIKLPPPICTFGSMDSIEPKVLQKLINTRHGRKGLTMGGRLPIFKSTLRPQDEVSKRMLAEGGLI